ncbi:MAG: N-acetyltransferase [Ruminococcaceae bacterium]|nr:N-acetyltransferase [Oscillospiraceae bacterium]
MFNIRLANENDVFGMLEIYTPYVTHSSVTFECEVPRTYEMKRRVNTVINKYPWLICEKDGMIAGYAYAHEFSKREAYIWAAEVSVYIKEDYQRCNIASALYYALIELLKKQGFCTAFARITVPNEKSLAFHNAFGFIEAGHLHNAGYKLGDWHDVKILEKSLIESYISAPKDIIPITELDKDEMNSLFRMAEKIIRER